MPRTFPYQKAGTAFNDDGVSVEEAFSRAKLRWTVNPYPLFFFHEQTDKGIQVDDNWAIVREDTAEPLGVVGNRYEIVDNHDVEAVLDVIKLPVHSAGERKGGQKCFVLFKQDEFSHGRDRYFTYLDAQWSHDGSSPLTINFRAHRLTCTNGSNRFIGGSNLVKIRHTASASEKMILAQETVSSAHEWQKLFAMELEFMTATRLTSAEVATVINGIIPFPKEKKDPRSVGRRMAKVDKILANYWKMPSEYHNSLYGLVHAVNEYEFWDAPVRGGDSRRAESQLQRLELDRFPLTQKALAFVQAEEAYEHYWNPTEGVTV